MAFTPVTFWCSFILSLPMYTNMPLANAKYVLSRIASAGCDGSQTSNLLVDPILSFLLIPGMKGDGEDGQY